MQSKKEELRQALKGLIQPHQRLMLKSMLTHIDTLNEQDSVKRMVKRIESLGFKVTLEELPAA
jgi:hypothetical protein